MKRFEDMTEPELREVLNAYAQQIKVVSAVMEVERPQFVLLIFNDPAVAQYIASCRRDDMVTALREAADRLDSREDVLR